MAGMNIFLLGGGRCTASLMRMGRSVLFAKPVLPVRSPQRVSFPVAAKSTQARNKNEEEDDRDMANKAKETIERPKETMKEGWEKAGDHAKMAEEKTKEGAQYTGQKANETAEEARERAKMAKENAKEGAKYMGEKAKETGHQAQDKASHGTKKVKETVNEGTSRVGEGVHSMGEKAKQTVEGAWGAAKGATQKITETVVGKGEEEERNETENQRGEPGRDEEER